VIAVTEDEVWQVLDGRLWCNGEPYYQQPPDDPCFGAIAAIAACKYTGVDTDPESTGDGPRYTRLAVEYASGVVYSKTQYGEWTCCP